MKYLQLMESRRKISKQMIKFIDSLNDNNLERNNNVCEIKIKRQKESQFSSH